jgi:uncharacterized protein (TIGR02996 family)
MDHNSFIQAIIEALRDDAPKLAYSDWLLENNFPVASSVWRWLGETGRSPRYDSWDGYSWGCNDNNYSVNLVKGHQHCLPVEIFKTISNSQFDNKIYFYSLDAAIAPIVNCLENLTKKRRWWQSGYQFIPSYKRVDGRDFMYKAK